ncbi:MAG: hypothetical protein ACRDTM_17400, partial [Micromonosporaceae bacterium]
ELALLLIAGVAALGVSHPARAETPRGVSQPARAEVPPKLTLTLQPVRSFAPGESSEVLGTFDIGGYSGEFPLTDVVLTIDVSDLDGMATIPVDGFDDPCDTDGDTVTCFRDGRDLVLHDGKWTGTLFLLSGQQPVAAGTTAQLPVTATSTTAGSANATATLTKAEAVDLAVSGPREFEKTAPLGGQVTVPMRVENPGDTTVDGLVLWWETGAGTYVEDTFSNCTYAPGFVVCRFDVKVAPGATYRLSRDFPIDVSTDQAAPGHARAHFQWSTIDTFEQDIQPGRPADREPGSLPAVKLVDPATGEAAPESPTAGDVPQHDLSDDGNDFGTVYITVTGDNPRDLAAVGATITGDAGAVVELTVGLRNVGKVPLEDPDSDSPWRIAKVTPPPGVTAVTVPEDCVTYQGSYFCEADSPFEPGTKQLWTFQVRIEERVGDAVGYVKLTGDAAADDQNPKNDTARILANPTASPSRPASATPSPIAGGPGRGGLSLTGSSLTWPIAGGVLAVIVGIALYLVARRRPDSAE